MTNIQKRRAKLVIRKVAKQNGVSTAQCRSAMAEAIREAWNTTDPEAKRQQLQLVGEERVPSPEEIIVLLSKM